jgi:hypothetical protein
MGLKMKKFSGITLAVLLLIIVSMTVSCTSTINTDTKNSGSRLSANGLSLSLSLDAATYQPGQGITIVLDEVNTLADVNTVPVSDNWVYNQFQKAPCDFISPYGLAVFSGDYTGSEYFDRRAAYHL